MIKAAEALIEDSKVVDPPVVTGTTIRASEEAIVEVETEDLEEEVEVAIILMEVAEVVVDSAVEENLVTVTEVDEILVTAVAEILVTEADIEEEAVTEMVIVVEEILACGVDMVEIDQTILRTIEEVEGLRKDLKILTTLDAVVGIEEVMLIEVEAAPTSRKIGLIFKIEKILHFRANNKPRVVVKVCK